MPHPAVAFVFSKVGVVKDCGGAEELAETPEAIETPVVLWHVAVCTGAEDFAAAAEDFVEGARASFEEHGREGIAADELGF